jgi:DNA-binding MarR family transcriptional regulator
MSARPKRKPTPEHTDTVARAAGGRAPLHAVSGHAQNGAKPATAPTDRTIPDLDKVIHERARLAIMSALATGASQTHNELRELLGLTDGNLSVHARRLEEAGYIACDKDFAGRMPRTTYKLTTKGRTAFERYLAHMEALIHTMRGK